ncbi:MAG: methyltransferase domain-containing protein [Chitinophagaceae bacterium]|nr:methyltransferase domain-containing protein [Chitinophagaceae bacterium]
MSFLNRVKQLFNPLREKDPRTAYDLWAEAYDQQPGNLVLDLDEALVTELLKPISIEGKSIADIGCGTGRHWAKLYAQSPARLIGYDVSPGMLEQLKQKYPGAETYIPKGELLTDTTTRSVDIVLSTLALAHMPQPAVALKEWDRILLPGGNIILTDYHPATLAKGGKRTFRFQGKTIAVKSYVHSVEEIRRQAGQLGWKVVRFTERLIDDNVKKYYEDQNATDVFEKFKGTPVIYGIHLIKADDPI